MATPGISPATSGISPAISELMKPPASTKTASSPNNTGFDKDTFLKLLVAQLKYQDPMKPTDSNALMQQSATFTQVEAMQNMQASMVAANQQTAFTGATNLLGKNVSALAADNTSIFTGQVTGVRYTADGPILQIGNTEVALSRVTKVTQ